MSKFRTSSLEPTHTVGATTWLRLAAFAAFVGGCAPLADLRPASGIMPGRSVELGMGAAALSPRPYVEEDWRSAGQLWVSADSAPYWTLSAVAALDRGAALKKSLAVGGAARINTVRTDRIASGAEGELGYAWIALSFPFALRTVDETWIYTAPRLGNFGSDVAFWLPLGVSTRLYGGFMLRAEFQTSWEDFKYYNRRTHWGGGVAYQW
jgi:hypothetical protein